MTLSATDAARLQHAIDSMVKESAVELPLDGNVVDELSKVSASTGFEGSGSFKLDCGTNPISTLLRFAKFLGT
jgi:hypothetical protein